MDDLRIVRARVRGGGAVPDLDARFARRAESALRGLDPGRAILCLREANGVLAEDAFAAPLSRAQTDWLPISRQVQARLAAARHPWREVVMPDAMAVCFADTAEWLACAALDLLAQRVERCWWWCSLPLAGAAGVIAAWQQHPRAVPAALALLAERGLAVRFAHAVGAQATALRQGLTQHFAMGGDVAAPADSPAVQTLMAALSDCTAAPKTQLPEAPRAWLWLALGLARAPAAACAAPIPPAVWMRPQAVAASAPQGQRRASSVVPQTDVPPLREQALPDTPQRPDEVPTQPPPFAPIPVRHAIGRSVAAILQAANDPIVLPLAPDEAQAPLPSQTTARARLRWNDVEPITALESPAPVRAADAVGAATEALAAESTGAHAAHSAAPIAGAPHSFGAALETAYGGVFHLLNLALALGLYPDFTSPAERGIALHPWDYLSLLARELVGAEFEADPLCGWLADAAGRPQGVEAGLWASAPERDWQMPPHWLTPWAAQAKPWRCVVARGRQALWHPVGFCVADLSGNETLLGAQWPGWAAPRRVVPCTRPAPRAVRSWADWIARFAAFVRARLAAATGWSQGDAAQRLLRVPARVCRSAEYLEVRMSLAALPIEVRLAGLDRDLGWLPAAGCDLRYHFDAGGPA